MFSTKNLILKQEKFHSVLPLDEKNALHIGFGLDSKFVMGMGVLIFSILKHNPNTPIVFHVFSNFINEKDLDHIKEVTQSHPVSINIFYMNVKIFKELPTKFVLPTAIYYRFIMANILYGQVDKLLYLDADILCINSLSELSHINLSDNYAAVIEDLKGMAEKAQKRNFGFKEKHYFNSGVLYININKWVESNIGWKAIELCNKIRFRQLAQDVLNLLFENKVLWLNKKYNLVYNLGFMTHEIPEDTIFIHFAGNSKPWQLWGQRHYLTDLYHSYQNQTPWKNTPLTMPHSYKQARFMAQYHYKHNEKIKSYYWGIKYLFRKIVFKIIVFFQEKNN